MKIDEKNVVGVLEYLRSKKRGGKKVSDLLYHTKPGRENPINITENPQISDVQFFDKQGGAVASTQPDKAMGLAQVYTQFGEYVWVREGSEALLLDDRWKNLNRVRGLE